MAQQPSRPKRWQAAVDKADEAIQALQGAQSDLADALQELCEVQQEYSDWKDGLPENLQNSPLGEKLDTVCELQIEDAADTVSSAIDEASNIVSEAGSVDLPQGFGRD